MRRNFLPSCMMSQAREPLVLLTADHSRMAGGKEEASLDIIFETDVQDPSTWVAKATFLDANINVDLILSYPWLRENEIAVYLHLECLGVDTPDRLYLKSLNARRKKKKRKLFEKVHEADVAQVRSWNMSVPTEVGEPLEDYLFHDDDALRYIASVLVRSTGGTTSEVARVVQASEPSANEDPKVNRLIEEIRASYDGTVLRESVWPNPPVRGPHGYGRIELKEGAVAKKMHHIFLTGPRREAMINLVKEWMRDEKVEDGYGEWVSPAFVVSKKGGRWRGVVDYRAFNEATKLDTHSLSWIANMLVQFGPKHCSRSSISRTHSIKYPCIRTVVRTLAAVH